MRHDISEDQPLSSLLATVAREGFSIIQDCRQSDTLWSQKDHAIRLNQIAHIAIESFAWFYNGGRKANAKGEEYKDWV